ncbi:MAG: hypothetical protein GY928_16655 [Colwellia sp.]|nr:hypothetical protein [Colwellia sp.]
MRKLLVGALTLIFLFPTLAISARTPCNAIIVSAKNPGSLGLISLKFGFEHLLKNGKVVKDISGNPAYEITQVATADASQLRTDYFTKAAENIPTDRCDKHIAHSYKIFPLSDGTAQGQFSYRFEDWFCGWADSKCTKMERQKVGQTPNVKCSKHLIPKCTVYWTDNFAHVPVVYSCKAKTTYKNFQKTFTSSTLFTPTVNSTLETIDVKGVTSIDDRGGVPNAVLNVVGILTLDIGSKWIRDNYRSKLSDIRSNLPTINESFLARNGDFEAPKLKLTSAKFGGDQNHLTLISESKAEVRMGKACQFQEYLLDSGLFN